MTNEQARKIFDDAIANTNDPDAIARIEIVREYACNPEFRQYVQDTVWQINQAKR